MFTIGLLSYNLPYALAFVAYMLIHFSAKPEFEMGKLDISIDNIVINNQLPLEESVSSTYYVIVDNKTKVLSYLKLFSENIVAKKCSHCIVDLTLPYQTPYLTKYSFLRPPPVL